MKAESICPRTILRRYGAVCQGSFADLPLAVRYGRQWLLRRIEVGSAARNSVAQLKVYAGGMWLRNGLDER